MSNLEKPIKKMLDITPGKGAKAKALSAKMGNVGKDRGFSLISRKPMKDSEMSPNRQYHRKQVRSSFEDEHGIK